MRKYCDQLEKGDKHSELNQYQNSFMEIKRWYLSQHHRYQLMLKNEMAEQMGDEILRDDKDRNILTIDNYTDNFGAKLTLFNVADFLCKHILSVYTYGPSDSMPVEFTKKELNTSWLRCDRNVYDISELTEMQLSTNGEGGRINFNILSEDRSTRSNLTHGGKIAACLSAIRCYNVLRDMIVFMDPDCASELSRFDYPEVSACDMQCVLHHTNDLNFETENTVLVVGSLHDIPAEGREMLANLPWNLVIDFDGYSAYGGLRSSVKHKNIYDQKLSSVAAASFTESSGYTAWLTCGDFCEPTYANAVKGRSFFKSKTPFCSDFHRFSSTLDNIFEKLISKLSAKLKPLTILYLYGSKDVAQNLLQKCEKHYNDLSYSFTGVYYISDEGIAEIESSVYASYIKYNESYDDRFKFISCNLDSFFNSILEYRAQFPQYNEESYTNALPSEEGFKEIPSNIAANLNEFFDVLYRNIGKETLEESRIHIDKFYHGATAPWCAFRNNHVIDLIRQQEYAQNLNKVRESLKRIPDMSSHKIINLIHKPGIGGSTLMRKIGWDLHEEYPVLLIRKYDATKVRELVWQLYDELKKGVLILADESINDIDRLKTDICTLPRACALLISSREGYANINAHEKKIMLTTITDKGENALRTLFCEQSSLSQPDKEKKNQGYYQFIQQDRSTMRCPFMIGLYYQDQNFNGVNDYVSQIMKGVSDVKEIHALAIISLCDYYGQSGFPKVLINNYLGLSQRSNYLEKHPYAAGAFILTTDFNDIQVYRSKHFVISHYLLEQCSQKLYNSTFLGGLKDFAILLIDVVFDACNSKYNEVFQEILERIFIDKSFDQQSFARLILDIPDPISRRSVLEHLATIFGDLAERHTPEDSPELYRMGAHFYGHLCRLCAKRDGGVENPKDAVKFGEKAVSLMETAMLEDPDPLIYHMLGDSKQNMLRHEWQNYQQANEKPSPDDIDRFEREIDSIRDIFDKAAYYGSEDYAIISKIGMYIQYLKAVYRWKNITDAKELSLLSDKQATYRAEIEELFNQLSDIPIGDKTRVISQNYEGEYRSDIMMNNYGKAIEYYQNLLDKLATREGSSLAIQETRRSLINVRLADCRKKSRNKNTKYSGIKSKELNEILNLLEQTIEQHVDANNYRERHQRMNAYSMWLELAKLNGSNRTVQQALSYAKRWEDLEKCELQEDPRPYYYQYVLYALSVLDGNKASIDQMHKYQRSSYNKARRSRYRTDSIRDILIEGTELNRLLDMRYANNPIEYLENSQVRPLVLQGTFEFCDGGKGHIAIQKPIAWNGEDIKFTLGTIDHSNTVGERQVTHNLGTFAAFTFEQLSSINKYLRDYSAHEPEPTLVKKAPDNLPEDTNVHGNNLIQKDQNIVLFTATKITTNKGLSGTIQYKSQTRPATLKKNFVTDKMLSQIKLKKSLQLQVVICGDSPQGDRSLLEIPRAKN